MGADDSGGRPFSSIGDRATGYDEGLAAKKPSAKRAPGTILAGKYRVEAVLGEGGMGTVYRAHDTLAMSDVALKLLNTELTTNETSRKRFLQEFRTSQRLGHPNIVRAYAVEQHENQYFYTMELVEGLSLREHIDQHRNAGTHFQVEEAVRIIEGLCSALQHAHETTVHRDIKPDNVLLTRQGVPKLMDFGIAKALETTDIKTRLGSSMGTAYYMAPEQLRNAAEVDLRADLYALGIMWYELLVGEIPFPGSPPPSEARPGVPSWADELFRRLVAPVDRRYASAAELREAIRGAQESEEAPTPAREGLTENEPAVQTDDVSPPRSRDHAALLTTSAGARFCSRASMAQLFALVTTALVGLVVMGSRKPDVVLLQFWVPGGFEIVAGVLGVLGLLKLRQIPVTSNARSLVVASLAALFTALVMGVYHFFIALLVWDNTLGDPQPGELVYYAERLFEMPTYIRYAQLASACLLVEAMRRMVAAYPMSGEIAERTKKLLVRLGILVFLVVIVMQGFAPNPFERGMRGQNQGDFNLYPYLAAGVGLYALILLGKLARLMADISRGLKAHAIRVD